MISARFGPMPRPLRRRLILDDIEHRFTERQTSPG
jgi:hypothetical protein